MTTSIHKSSKSSPIQLNSLIDNLKSSLLSLKFLNLHHLILHFLIVLEESVHLLQNMLWKLNEVIIMRNRHIALSNSDNLIVFLTLIDHPHHSNDFGFKQAERINLNRAKHQNIQGIIVLTVSLRNEAIVGWIVHCTEEYSVKSQ